MTDTDVHADHGAYPGTALAAAAIATFFFPVISIIAGLLLLSQQREERKRATLRTWVWASVGWILVQAVIFVLLFVAVTSGSGSEPVRLGP